MTEDSTEINQFKKVKMIIGQACAFPVPETHHAEGMTYREYLIGQAIQGSAGLVVRCYPSVDDIKTKLVGNAVAIADEVLTQLAQERLEKTGGSNG